MSSEAHKYIEGTLDKSKNSFKGEVIDFPHDYKISKVTNYGSWKLHDKSNIKDDGDQLKAVIGICFTFAALIIIGLYSNFY